MSKTKESGDIGEAAVISEALKRGYKVALPFGEDWKYDLIVLRKNRLERVQCKYVKSNGEVIIVRCRSCNNWNVHKYTSDEIDWIAVYDETTQKIYFVPSAMLGSGRAEIYLRITPAKNNQKRSVLMAKNFLDW